MKKIFVLLFCLTLLLSLFIVPTSAAGERSRIEALYGTPVIDGEVDEIWSHANQVEVKKLSSNIYQNPSDTTGKVKVLWDENYIYVLAEIYDSFVVSKPSTDAPQDCDTDGIDFQISELNIGGSGDMRTVIGNGNYNVAVSGALTGWGKAFEDGSSRFLGEAIPTDYGYMVEACIPFTTLKVNKRVVGTIISMEFQINDNLDGVKRGAIIDWNADQCLGHANSKDHGEVVFVAGPNGEVPPVITEAPDTEPPVATEPAATEPAATEPAATEPAATEPAATEPAGTEPADTEPAGMNPIVIVAIVAAVVAAVVVVVIIVKKKK